MLSRLDPLFSCSSVLYTICTFFTRTNITFQVLATCSFDRTACVWEEVPGDDPKAESDRRTRQAQERRQKKQAGAAAGAGAADGKEGKENGEGERTPQVSL